MASASSNSSIISVAVVLFILICSPFSTPAAQKLPETSQSPVELKFTTKRLHRISVQFSSLLAQIIDSSADDVATTTTTTKLVSIRELLAVISALESLLNQSTGMRGADVLAHEMVPTLESLKYVISSIDEADSISLPSSTVSDEFSNLLKRLHSLMSSLELDITALFTANKMLQP